MINDKDEGPSNVKDTAGAAIGLGILMVMVKNRAGNLITILLLFLIAFSILTVFRPDILAVFRIGGGRRKDDDRTS